MKPLLSTRQATSKQDFRLAAEHGITTAELDLTNNSLDEAKHLLRTLHDLQFTVPTLHYDLQEHETGVQDVLQDIAKATQLVRTGHVSITPPNTTNTIFPELARLAATNNCTVSIETRGEYARLPVLNAVMDAENFTVSLHTKEVTERSAPLREAVERVNAPVEKIRVSDAFLGEQETRVPGTGDIPLDDVFALVDAQSRSPFIVLDLPEFTADALSTAVHHFEHTLFSRVPDRFQLSDDVNGNRVNPVPLSKEQ